MNTILNPQISKPTEVKLSDICGANFNETKSAFIGNRGQFKNELFLVHFGGIIVASHPTTTWSLENSGNSWVEIIKWVDIEIRIKE